MYLSRSSERYSDTSRHLSSHAGAGADTLVVLHRLRGGDEFNDKSSVDDEDLDSNNDDVSESSSQPIIAVAVDTSLEIPDKEGTDDNIDRDVNDDQELEEEKVTGDEMNNIDENSDVAEVMEGSTTDNATEDEESTVVKNTDGKEDDDIVELVDETSVDSGVYDKVDDETEGSEPEAIPDIVFEKSDSTSDDNEYDDDRTDVESTSTPSPDTYEVQSNELRTSASDKRALAKTHHDSGNLKDAAIAFREAAVLLDEAMEALSQSSSIIDGNTKEEEEGNIAVERATCRLHEALCLLKDGKPGDCVEACTDVLDDDVTVVSLDNESDKNDSGDDDDTSEQPRKAAVVKIIPATTATTGAAKKPAIPAQIRARAHHRRAKARLALGDLDGALEDARSAAFMGDRNAVQFYGRLMREGSAGAELSPSPMGMGAGSNPFLDGMLGGMGGNTNPFLPSTGAGSSSDFSSSLLSSLLTGSSGSGGGNPFGLMGELLSPPDESKGSSKRRRGKAKKDSLAKSVLKNVMKRIEDEKTQETICGYLQSTNKQQIMQFSTMAGVPIKEETAQRLSTLANGITPKGIRKGVRRVKRGLKIVKTGRKILKVIDKYKPVIIVAVLVYWVRSAILEPYPISKKKKLAQQAAFGLLILPSQKSAFANVRGALSKVLMSANEADTGGEDDSSSTGIEKELEKLQHQLTLIEAIEERNKAQIYSFIDEEDQWNAMEEWEQELLSSKDALTQRMEQLTEELVLLFIGEKSKNG